MNTTIDQIEGNAPVRDYPPDYSRLSIQGGGKRRGRQWRGVVREMASTFVWTFLLCIGLYVAVSGLIGCVRGLASGVSDLYAIARGMGL